MELVKYSDQLYHQLEESLEKVNGSIATDISKFSDALFAVTGKLNLLRKYITEKGFVNQSEEINCFKIIYPKFYCWYIYLTEEFSIINNVPVGTDQMIRDYYLQELALIKRYFNQNQFAYQYYLHDEIALDDDYFLRKNFVLFRQGYGLAPADGEYSTNQGYQFARFKAYDMLQEFIIKRIRLLYHEPENALLAELLKNEKRNWTGEKINLIEIAYGVYYTGQLNNGKADIKDVISWLETSLNVDLSQAYRMFIDIRRRKTTSYTKFLEKMADSIRLHIDESYDYKPKK